MSTGSQTCKSRLTGYLNNLIVDVYLQFGYKSCDLMYVIDILFWSWVDIYWTQKLVVMLDTLETKKEAMFLNTVCHYLIKELTFYKTARRIVLGFSIIGASYNHLKLQHNSGCEA
jgi:hypothetical protein